MAAGLLGWLVFFAWIGSWPWAVAVVTGCPPVTIVSSWDTGRDKYAICRVAYIGKLFQDLSRVGVP